MLKESLIIVYDILIILYYFILEWVIVANELAQGVLALFIINTSDKKQRIVWIAGSLALFAVASFTLLIPELVHPLEERTGTILGTYFFVIETVRRLYNIQSYIFF